MYEANSSALGDAYGAFIDTFEEDCFLESSNMTVCSATAISGINSDMYVSAKYMFDYNFSSFSSDPTFVTYANTCRKSGNQLIQDTVQLQTTNYTVNSTTVFEFTFSDMPLCVAASCDASDQQEFFKSQLYEILLADGADKIFPGSIAAQCRDGEADAAENQTCSINFASSAEEPAEKNIPDEVSACTILSPLNAASAAFVVVSFLHAFYF